MTFYRSSLEECLPRGPFCWSAEPRTIYRFIVQPEEGFPKGDALYQFNLTEGLWDISCAGDHTCGKGCLVHALQHRDPVIVDRIFYNTGNIALHLEHLDFLDEIVRENDPMLSLSPDELALVGD